MARNARIICFALHRVRKRRDLGLCGAKCTLGAPSTPFSATPRSSWAPRLIDLQPPITMGNPQLIGDASIHPLKVASIKRMVTAIRTAIEQSKKKFHVLTVAETRALGLSRGQIARLVEAGHWQRLFRGIYLTHSASPSWFSKAQAALLVGGPHAVLTHESAWFLNGLQPKPPRIITVNVPPTSRLKPRPGIRFLRHVHDFQPIGRRSEERRVGKAGGVGGRGAGRIRSA